jgi:hypothetical protein
MNMYEYSAIAAGLLLSASDFIGNNLEVFRADNKALDDIRTNEKFRAYVKREVDNYPDEYEDLPKEEAAHIVWDMYQSWAY